MISHRAADANDAAEISAPMSSFEQDLVDPAQIHAGEYLAAVSTGCLREYLASPSYSFLLAQEDGKLIGVIAIKDRSHLHYFFVDRAHQKRGVGRKLWELARAEALAGRKSGFFSVGASMNAVPVYARLGFKEAGPPHKVHGVMCVPMVAGEPDGARLHSLVLPSEAAYPAMNAAAEEILQALGPWFTGTSGIHIPTAIAAAASLAGSVLRRAGEPDPESHAADGGRLSGAHRRQANLLIFIEIFASEIDPGIERSFVPGAGLQDYGWEGELPPADCPLFDADTMIGRLETLREQVTQRHGLPPMLHAHIPALAAMKLVSSGHKSGLLERNLGRALVRAYMAAGCKTEPLPIHGK